MKIAHTDDNSGTAGIEDVVPEPDFKPLTADQAAQWRKNTPSVSPWRMIGLQMVTGFVASVMAGLFSASGVVALSVASGALAVVVPAVVFALGMRRLLGCPATAMVGFVIWELVKIVLTVALLLVATQLVERLNWLALLGGFVVTMKVVWVAMCLRPGRTLLVGKN